MHRHAARLAATALIVFLASAAHAQYPNKPVKVLVPIPPGGAPDIAARVVSEKLSEALGQQFVVENRPGSNGNIASELTVRAAPDGYTLLLCADSQITINPHLYRNMTFDPIKDLLPLATVASNDFVLSVNPKLPVKTLAEFVEYAKKANPPLPYASGGNGSQHHLTMEMLKQRAGINLTHVPYRGGSPATTATVQGEVAAMFAGSSTAPQIHAGNLRALASSGSKRSAAFPDLPTLSETYPGLSNSIWLAMFAPKDTPAPIVAKLRQEINNALAQPDTKEKFNRAGGLEPYVSTPQEFTQLIRTDYDKFAKLVKDINLKVD